MHGILFLTSVDINVTPVDLNCLHVGRCLHVPIGSFHNKLGFIRRSCSFCKLGSTIVQDKSAHVS